VLKKMFDTGYISSQASRSPKKRNKSRSPLRVRPPLPMTPQLLLAPFPETPRAPMLPQCIRILRESGP
jgi:hypothetical protein